MVYIGYYKYVFKIIFQFIVFYINIIKYKNHIYLWYFDFFFSFIIIFLYKLIVLLKV
jgi:hypothetical protein